MVVTEHCCRVIVSTARASRGQTNRLSVVLGKSAKTSRDLLYIECGCLQFFYIVSAIVNFRHGPEVLVGFVKDSGQNQSEDEDQIKLQCQRAIHRRRSSKFSFIKIMTTENK